VELVHVAGVQQWGSCCSKAALEINPDMMFHFADFGDDNGFTDGQMLMEFRYADHG